MKRDVRTMRKVYHAEAKSAGRDGVKLSFHGETLKSGRQVTFEVTYPWDYLPHLVPNIQRHWADERARRLVAIAEIDSALPKPQ